MKRYVNPRTFASLQLLAATLSLVFAGCSREPTVQMPTAEDRRVAKKAIAPNEILLMLRGGYKEKEVIAEINRRPVSEVVDSITENKLLDAGATGALITAMKSNEHVLTAPQKIAYDQDQTEREQQMQTDLANRRDLAASEEAARQQELRPAAELAAANAGEYPGERAGANAIRTSRQKLSLPEAVFGTECTIPGSEH